ncbi:CPBP family intramembrane metalloprotease domain-containing protein [Corynebacterium sp. 13CS0277]|uniref:CPBP family intramembrane glutamic endopeptidase n=1 Tax=Corynebacterium sp. 13CS0277 TaxID=2071994 RepID=UPI000D0242A7|nr:CPBP family intramembrane glutamic endopeptidase [Corynebacterium sp. 13CS0277]PRQ11673.1 CPBP family intramembrane metalloprotease domain-containing protein [Corynebacterium sp. 13CS0277]
MNDAPDSGRAARAVDVAREPAAAPVPTSGAWGTGPVVRDCPDERVRDAHGVPTGGLTAVPWAAVGAFVVLAFGLAWLVAIPLWMHRPMTMTSMTDQLWFQVTGAVMMATPVAAALICLFVFKIPPAGRRLAALGLTLPHRVWRFVAYLVLAAYLPVVVSGLIVAHGVAFGLADYDLSRWTQPVAPGVSVTLQTQVLLQLALFPLGVIVNAILALGEELGWRGYLTTVLRPLGVWPTVLITGAIWGLWHSPLLLLGYNYNLRDWRAPVLMMVACMAIGAVLGWLRLSSGSVWPAVFAHAGLNGSAGITLMFFAQPMDAHNLVWCGPLGVLAVVVWAEVIILGLLAARVRARRAARRVSAAPTTA